MIALVFPFLGELQGFVDGLTGVSELKAGGLRTFSLQDEPEWLLAVGGQGKVETALTCQMLHSAFALNRFLLLGSAGALDPALMPGDIVVGERCLEWDFLSKGEKGPNPPPSFRPSQSFPPVVNGPAYRVGTILSADRDLFDPEEKSRLFRESGAALTAWEGAGFHRFLKRSGAVGWEIRVVVEAAGEARLSRQEFMGRMERFFPPLRPLAQAVELAGRSAGPTASGPGDRG